MTEQPRKGRTFWSLQTMVAARGGDFESADPAVDARRFDVEVVRTVVAFVNDVVVAGAAADASAKKHLRWMCDPLMRRASSSGIRFDEVKLAEHSGATGPRECDNAARSFHDLLVRTWARPTEEALDRERRRLIRSAASGEVQIPPDSPLSIRARLDADLDACVREVEIRERLVVIDGAVHRLSVPLLYSYRARVAYALSLILEDRWTLRGRVRACPYRATDEEPPHFYVDFRIRPDGKFVRGRELEACSERHRAAHYQRELRAQRRVEDEERARAKASKRGRATAKPK